MTLRDTIWSFLEQTLIWAKERQNYWGTKQKEYKREYQFQKNIFVYHATKFVHRIESFFTGDR